MAFRWPNPFARQHSGADGGPSLWVGDRLVRFLLVGAMGVVVNLGALLLFVEGFGGPPVLASPIAIEASILFNYTLNRRWTWRDRGKIPYSMSRYHGVSLIGMGIQWLVLVTGLYLLGLHYLLAALLGIVLATGWNFLSNDRFTFTRITRPARTPRALLYAAALLLHLVVAALLAHPWDTFVFQRTLNDFLAHGITPYTTAMQGGDHIFLVRHLPIQQHWYAYPPLPLLLLAMTSFPAALGLVDSAWAGRILISLPAIIGTLALAAAARHMVGTAKGHASSAHENPILGAPERAERWFLFNPLFILIAGVWGQMEALIVFCLVLSVLIMRSRRWALAGSFWGLAVLVKPFALFLVPVLAIHLMRVAGMRAATRFFGAGAAVAALVSLPFFLLEPTGFLRQTLFMHLERPPSRFSPLAAVYYMFREGAEIWPTALPDPVAVAAVIGAVSLLATIAVLAGLAITATRKPATEGHLLFWMAVSSLAALLTSKVLNEQYLLLPLGLLAVWYFHPEADNARRTRARVFLMAATWGVFIAALTERAALFQFIPEDVSQWLIGRPVLDVFAAIAWSLGLTVSQLTWILGAAAIVCLLVALVTALRLLLPEFRQGWVMMTRREAPFLSTGAASVRISVSILVFVILIGYPVATAIMATPANGVEPLDAEGEEPYVLALYRTDWYNPSHDPQRIAGSWTHSTVTPESGYYNLNAHKVTKDLTMMSDSGVQGVLIVLHPMHMKSAVTVKRIAEAMQMPYAVVLDLRLVEDTESGAFWNAWSDTQVEELVRGPPLAGWAGKHYLRDAATDRPFLFVRNHEDTDPTPLTTETSPGDHQETEWTDWATEFQDPRRPQIVLVDENPADAGDPFNVAQNDGGAAGISEDSHGFRWLTVEPFTPEAYRAAWTASGPVPAGVVVPWNEFDLGNAVEPSREHGDAFLEITRSATRSVHPGDGLPKQ